MTTLITWLTAPSLVNLSLTIQATGQWDVLSTDELERDWLHDSCGGSPNLQQLKVEYSPEHCFHAKRLSDGEWVVHSSFGRKYVTSWYHAATELAETEGNHLLAGVHLWCCYRSQRGSLREGSNRTLR